MTGLLNNQAIAIFPKGPQMKGYQTETFVQTFPVLQLCTYVLCAEHSLPLTPGTEAETLQRSLG